MKPIGAVIAPMTFGGRLCKEAVQTLLDAKGRSQRDLLALGISGDSAYRLVQTAEDRLLATVHLCESPIEQVMLTALSHLVVRGTDCFPPAIHDVASGEPWPVRPVIIVPQFVIARYRLDFLVAVERTWFAVECDGANFHSSMQQRDGDTERDEYLKAIGIRTIRYSGSWIIKNLSKVADEVAAILCERSKAA